MNSGAAWKSCVLSAELPLVLVILGSVFLSIPIAGNGLGLSSDTLNHHVYLGWISEQARFDRDFLAASYQSYQFPYSYWPLYRLLVGGYSGLVAGLVLAALQLLIVPPVWLMARACMPGSTLFDALLRVAATVLAFMSSVVLLNLGTTANDLLASVPFVWAMAFAIGPLDARMPGWLTPRRAAGVSGALAGLAIALKLSNGPLALALPVLWWFSAASRRERLICVAVGTLATASLFVAVYGPWGVQLWRVFGNPVYPAYDGLFAPMRTWLGWKP